MIDKWCYSILLILSFNWDSSKEFIFYVGLLFSSLFLDSFHFWAWVIMLTSLHIHFYNFRECKPKQMVDLFSLFRPTYFGLKDIRYLLTNSCSTESRFLSLLQYFCATYSRFWIQLAPKCQKSLKMGRQSFWKNMVSQHAAEFCLIFMKDMPLVKEASHSQ